METPLRATVENEIRRAFRGITLGRGMSLRQAQLADRHQQLSGDALPHLHRRAEFADDWTKVGFDEIEGHDIAIAHLDAPAFRYYIPALMLSILDRYDPSSMRVIGTLGGLYPKKGDEWQYHMHRYSLLSPAQMAAIARFLAELPKLVQLDPEDQKITERALRNYWGQYLQTSAAE